MKEIIALHDKLAAEAPHLLSGTGINFSRDESEGDIATLSEELQGEISALQTALNDLIPADLDYFLFAGGEEGPAFDLTYNQMPADPEGGWNEEESIFDQLRNVDWDAARNRASTQDDRMRQIVGLLDRLMRPLPSAKRLQRDYREDVKEFVKEKRRDADKVHVLYLDDEDDLSEADFADGEAFRAALPEMIRDGHDIFAVVAGGKPLPVERVDALNARAQAALQEKFHQQVAKADEPDDAIEAEIIEMDAPETPPPAAS